jgi:hypothetical protein
MVTALSSSPRAKKRPSPVDVEPDAARPAVTMPEAVWLLNCSPNFVWELLRKNRLKSFTMGRQGMIARSAIEAFAETGGTELAGPGPSEPT